MPGPAMTTWHSPTQPMQASDARLACLVDDLWRTHFADVPRPNAVVTGFGYPWQWRLGRIRMSLDGGTTEITLNGLLDDPTVPREIYVAIIAHEIVHYAQGFASPLPRAQRHAHADGAVSRELARRGLGATEGALLAWGADVWPALRARQLAARRTRRAPLVLAPCAVAGNMV